jgi:hypothetical protein
MGVATRWPFYCICLLLCALATLQHWPSVIGMSPLAIYMAVRQALQEHRISVLLAERAASITPLPGTAS